MKAVIVSLLILTSGFVHADDESLQQERWVCYAQGKQSFGGPVGDIWHTVTGQGGSQYEALHRAQQNCLGQGLQSCNVSSCYKY